MEMELGNLDGVCMCVCERSVFFMLGMVCVGMVYVAGGIACVLEVVCSFKVFRIGQRENVQTEIK